MTGSSQCQILENSPSLPRCSALAEANTGCGAAEDCASVTAGGMGTYLYSVTVTKSEEGQEDIEKQRF